MVPSLAPLKDEEFEKMICNHLSNSIYGKVDEINWENKQKFFFGRDDIETYMEYSNLSQKDFKNFLDSLFAKRNSEEREQLKSELIQFVRNKLK